MNFLASLSFLYPSLNKSLYGLPLSWTLGIQWRAKDTLPLPLVVAVSCARTMLLPCVEGKETMRTRQGHLSCDHPLRPDPAFHTSLVRPVLG